MLQNFKQKLLELAHLKSSLALLQWDQEVYMPSKGADMRASTVAYLSGLLHEKFLTPEFETMLNALVEDWHNEKLSEEDAAIVREVKREFVREKKLPAEFVKELAELTSRSHLIWVEARKKADFSLFCPQLKKIVELKRKEAELVGFEDSPYDALLDIFEPNITAREIGVIFAELKQFLVPFIQTLTHSKNQPDTKKLRGNFEESKQYELSKLIALKMGLDWEAGRIDVSAHPFTQQLHPQDVRITIKYDKENLFWALSSIIHEVGHALYEQGLPAENFGTPLGESVSTGIHEAQARMWENIIGKSKPFWNYFYPPLRQFFPEPFAKLPCEEFYRCINAVQPGLIRVEADEITYSLHIILRFELERELIEGSIAVEHLPELWNEKMKTYLGIETPDAAQGVLQDVHWSEGYFGYFPVYALGNLYGAQFFAGAQRDILNLEKEMAEGRFEHLREWLRQHIHLHGKRYTTRELLERATGEPLTSRHFIEYLKTKFGDIYQLER